MLRLLVFLLLFAAVLYAVFWLVDRRGDSRPAGGGGSDGDPGGGGRPIPRAPRGPDDDEDFLRELERRARQQRRGQGQPSDEE